MGWHPWECQQHSPHAGGGAPTPPPPPDYNVAQIIILNYNLQQTQSPICLILALPPPSINPLDGGSGGLPGVPILLAGWKKPWGEPPQQGTVELGAGRETI